MDIETFRWFMSTVAQTLGALTAIVVAVYTMWIQRLRFLQEDIKRQLQDYSTSTDMIQLTNGSRKSIAILCKEILQSYKCDNTSKYLEQAELDPQVNTKNFEPNVFGNLEFSRGEYQRRINDMKKAQQLWRPIFISLLSVFASLILLGFDRMIIPSAVNSTWGWVCFFIISAMVLVSLFLYFVFLFDVVAPYYDKHSRWKRFWKGLFDKDYPYNDKDYPNNQKKN